MLSAIATALGLTYVYTEKYEAYTAISYRVQEVTRFKAQQSEAMGSPAPQAPFKVIGATLQEVLKSDALLTDAVRALRLDAREPPDYSGPWYQSWYRQTKDFLKEYSGYGWKLLKYGRIVDDDPQAQAVDELRANIKVVNRDSYIFHIYVRDKHPERAALIANYMSAVLATWLLEYDRQPGRRRAEQLGAILETKREELELRRGEIETLLRTNQVASVQLETERMTENLSSLRLELSRLSSEIARAQSRQASVQNKLAMKEHILGGNGGGAGSAPVEFIPPEDFRKLASQRVFEDVELKSLLAKREALEGSIEAINNRLRTLPGVQSKLEAMKLSLSASEREYTLLRDGYSEARVRATSAVSEARVLHAAVAPTSPVAPIKVYHVLLAGALALLLSVGLVYLLDYLGIDLLFARRDEPEEVPVLVTEAPAEIASPPDAAPVGPHG